MVSGQMLKNYNYKKLPKNTSKTKRQTKYSLIISAIISSLEISNEIQLVFVYMSIVDNMNCSINPRCEENEYLSIC